MTRDEFLLARAAEALEAHPTAKAYDELTDTGVVYKLVTEGTPGPDRDKALRILGERWSTHPDYNLVNWYPSAP